MPDRPLIILPAPARPLPRVKIKKSFTPSRPQLPTIQKQQDRLETRFTVLHQVFDAQQAQLQTDAAGLIPEDVIVLETVETVDGFIEAVRLIQGLEWLGEIAQEDIPPDDDFFFLTTDGTPREDKPIPARLFMIFSNHTALEQILSLWNLWKTEHDLPWGYARWGTVFSLLRDVRTWGVQDRLIETGVIDDWKERIQHGSEIVPCEIELWFRNNPHQRETARSRVASLLRMHQGVVVAESIIPEIAYHALLCNLPMKAIEELIDESRQDIELLQCKHIQFFRATGQMAGGIIEGEHKVDEDAIEEPMALGPPVVALFDGLPLQSHQRLAGTLDIDDPDDFESQYPANDRRHGTAMASLIVNGDITANEPPLNRKLYVRPILRPDLNYWGTPHPETIPEEKLVVDVIHRAVRRLFESEDGAPAVAEQICAINLSVGISDRLFSGALSPLARLLDWLAWKYKVLFLVSAGNQGHSLELDVPRNQVSNLTPHQFQECVVKAVASDARNRSLLSPAEAVNVITVGAVNADESTGNAVQRSREPYVDLDLPSIINAHGMGLRRAIKPDVLLPGGKIILTEDLSMSPTAKYNVYNQTLYPGQLVAAPGRTAGDNSNIWYTRGTSNATALGSRVASRLFDVIEELRSEPGGDLLEDVPPSIWIKTLMVHSASWGAAYPIFKRILKTDQNGRQFKAYVSRLLGYGNVDPERVYECASNRVTTLGGGRIEADQMRIHTIPLPPSLSGQRGLRRLIITLSWLTPVNKNHQAWRRASLVFEPPSSPLEIDRAESDHNAVKRGTVQHEILEGKKATDYLSGSNIEIKVVCRPSAGTLQGEIPYALAVTLEVADEIGIDIYEEVNTKVQAARVRVAPGS